MCGIAAIFAYRSSSESVRREELATITEHMRPRGPDGGGTWISRDGRVGLGSRRLAIIDLSDVGAQPMFDVRSELAIVFNGEIYNYPELRASLVRTGVTFRSHSDTEVLLELYRRDPEAMVGLLRGMYAFAIWDLRARRMFVARDPYGIKPLYFADDGGTIRFASTVKSLVAGGAVSAARDPAGAAGFFLMGSVPEPFTICKAIRAVEAGTSFSIEEERGRGDPRRHYSVADVYRRANEQRIFARLTTPEIALRERIEESVAHHMVADVPVGLFLSAGIDSSALATVVTRVSRNPVHTFTLTYPEFQGDTADEAPAAKRLAAELGMPHTTRTVTRDEFRADLPKILEAMDQPTIDGINTWFVSKAVHESGLKVALSGVGGDELFGSYPAFRNVPRVVKLTRWPLAGRAASMSPHPKAAYIGLFGRTYGGAYLLQRGLFMPAELPSIMGPATAAEGLERLAIFPLIESAMTPDPGTDFGRVASLESCQYLRNQLLRDTDWAGMAHSVEIRTPLVDAALLRQIAPVLLEHGSKAKGAMAGMLPSWLRSRRKTGFLVPMAQWADLPRDATSTRMRGWAKWVFERSAMFQAEHVGT